MAGKKYSAILTPAGEAKLAAAVVTGEPVSFSSMGVGDGGGLSYQPTSETKALVNELYRAPLNRLVIADSAANVIRAEMVILPQIGGFWIREAALYDDDGICLVVASLPPSYKPQISEGSGRLHSVNLCIAVSNTADVELTVDNATILASVEEVNRAKDEAKDYTDDLGTELKRAIEEAVKQAVSNAWELDNPVGTTRFFNQNIDPNDKWPWSEWAYTGEDRSIRVAKADGSNVATTGGSDNATLEKGNLPNITLSVSGETGEVEQSELETEPAGKHNHISDPLFDKLSARASDLDGEGTAGAVDDQEATGEYRVAQMIGMWDKATMIDAEDHQHSVIIPAHKHTVGGKTEALGEGQSFSIVEAHILLMCWTRVA